MIGGRGNKRPRRKYTKPAVQAPRRPAGTALPFDRSLAHLCWQIGLSHESTAWVMGRSVGEVRHEWSVLTGLPIDGDPTPEQIERETAAIRAEWTPEAFLAAAQGIRHDTSTKHRGDKRCETTNKPVTGKRQGRSPGCSRSTGLLQPSR